MATITRRDFVNTGIALGKQFRGLATITTIVKVKDHAMIRPKTSGNSGRLVKCSRFQAVINPKPNSYMPKWCYRIAQSGFVGRYTKRYLPVKPLRTFEEQWYLDGKPVEKSDIDHMLHNRPRPEGDERHIFNYRMDGIYNVKYTTPDGVKVDIDLID